MKLRFRLMIVVCLSAVCAENAHAQKVDDLVEGVRIRVEVPRVRPVEGTFQSATIDSMKLISDGVHLVFPRSDSVVLFRSAGVHRSRSALLVGAVAGMVGAAVGAAIGSSSFKPCDSKGFYDCGYVPNTKSGATVFGASVFGVSSLLIGGVVGALGAGDTWVPVGR